MLGAYGGIMGEGGSDLRRISKLIAEERMEEMRGCKWGF